MPGILEDWLLNYCFFRKSGGLSLATTMALFSFAAENVLGKK
jgi:hypothetical protein